MIKLCALSIDLQCRPNTCLLQNCVCLRKARCTDSIGTGIIVLQNTLNARCALDACVPLALLLMYLGSCLVRPG
jgi:hypothetical protein